MSYCFSNCANLIELANLPTSNITNMNRCFIDCKNLTACPDIPASVANMDSCFNRCEKLTGVKLKCNYTPTRLRFAFNGCTALKDGGIKVPAAYYNNYTASAALTAVQVPGANDAAKKAKFEAVWEKVTYADLADYLANTALATEVNYIEVTGTIPKEDFKSVDINNPSALGEKLKNNQTKKVALKIETYPSDLTDMTYCFSRCANLVSLANLPARTIRNMASCFVSCAELTAVPDIPAGVTDIPGCFAGCKKLTTAPAIPESVTNMYSCFSSCESLIAGPDIPANVKSMTWCFRDCSKLTGVKLLCDYNPNQNQDNSNKAFTQTFIGCSALTDGGIKVPAAYYDNYTASAALTTMQVPGANDEAKKKKFAKY